MVLGISGKINSGKDTVASMIQGVHDGYSDEDILSTIKEQGGFYKNHVSFEIRRFADTLKDITCMLIGCTREQLEDREFKEKPLGKEWDKYVIKDGSTTLSSPSKKLMYEVKKKRNLDAPVIVEHMTPRKIMQLLGTECGREIIHPNVWVNALFAEYHERGGDNWNPGPLCMEMRNYKYPNWIIPDTRFENEAQAIRDRGGILIRVERYNKQDGSVYGWGNPNADHPSETSLDNWKDWNHVIDNDGTLEDLLTKVKGIYE